MSKLPTCKLALDPGYDGLWRLYRITGNMTQKVLLLADIQQDFTGLSGNVFVTDVYALAGTGKRKRSELALAIDRQGINIYDVSLCAILECHIFLADN